uniref:DUF6598 domain-containing protein n=1 Tax=Zea mays TaxID=4577 RepID=B6UB56_MAIZE|nr:hypothetical protein [Zea mays]|eukprot:NP_001145298.1 uncharacterized protein LOC100278599 [Zea mays]
MAMLHSWRHLDLVLRYSYGSLVTARSIGLKCKKQSKLDWQRPFRATNYARGQYFATTKMMNRVESREVTNTDEDAVCPVSIIENTSHRDGSIYRRCNDFLTLYRITDRGETRLEPMALSEPTNCQPNREKCIRHLPKPMMQIFSLTLGKIPIERDSVELYGYMAVRDDQDLLLNYIVNRSRDEAILLQKDSLIEMTGPKRGISMISSVLVEFDMRIKNGDREEDDLQLIDGMIDYSELRTPCWPPFTYRINGDCGAVDMTVARILCGVEATIEVFISEVHAQEGVRLSLSSFVFVSDSEEEEIQLFNGIVGESSGLRYAVAVFEDTWMHLKFKVGKNNDLKDDAERCIPIEVNTHGCVSKKVNFDLASMSVKVTWSTLTNQIPAWISGIDFNTM